jgi:amidase
VWATIAILNGLPATTLPIGKSPEGLPIGAPLIGGFLQDRTTIALAGMIERKFGGFSAPPDF